VSIPHRFKETVSICAGTPIQDSRFKIQDMALCRTSSNSAEDGDIYLHTLEIAVDINSCTVYKLVDNCKVRYRNT
jgi:hypothetical protein